VEVIVACCMFEAPYCVLEVGWLVDWLVISYTGTEHLELMRDRIYAVGL
jgi:hypothetical protein